jgi:hypothetical protein
VAHREAAINWLISSFLSEIPDFYVIRPRILPELSKRSNKSLLPMLATLFTELEGKSSVHDLSLTRPDVHESAFRWAAAVPLILQRCARKWELFLKSGSV